MGEVDSRYAFALVGSITTDAVYFVPSSNLLWDGDQVTVDFRPLVGVMKVTVFAGVLDAFGSSSSHLISLKGMAAAVAGNVWETVSVPPLGFHDFSTPFTLTVPDDAKVFPVVFFTVIVTVYAWFASNMFEESIAGVQSVE